MRHDLLFLRRKELLKHLCHPLLMEHCHGTYGTGNLRVWRPPQSPGSETMACCDKWAVKQSCRITTNRTICIGLWRPLCKSIQEHVVGSHWRLLGLLGALVMLNPPLRIGFHPSGLPRKCRLSKPRAVALQNELLGS